MNIYFIIIIAFFILLFVSSSLALLTVVSWIKNKTKLKSLDKSAVLDNQWTGEDAVFILSYYFIASFLASIIPVYIKHSLEKLPGCLMCDESIIEYAVYLSANMLFLYIPGIFICLFFVYRLHRNFSYGLHGILNCGKDILYGCLCFLRILAPVMIVSFLSVHVLKALGYDVSPQEILSTFSRSDSFILSVYIAFIVVIVGPVFEELIFRGILLQYLLTKLSLPAAVLCVSLGFAAIHYHIPSFLPLFILACGMSVAYIHSGKIIVPITMHILFNAVNLLILTAVTASGMQ